jgi:cytochrome c556
MSFKWPTPSRAAAVGLFIAGTALTLTVSAQTAPTAGAAATPPAATAGGPPSASDQAITVRKAVYTLIGNNFGPIGGVLQGKTPFDGAEALKRAERVAFLASLSVDAYPEISKTGNTRAKPEIWANRADFDKKLKDFTDHSNALVAALRKDSKDEDGFKAAAKLVASDCKGCHEDFRTK